MKKAIILLSLLLAFALVCTACAGSGDPAASTEPAPASSEAAVTEAPAQKATVSLGLLKGPTGMGAAELLSRNAEDAARNTYNLTLAAAPDQIQAGLISGELDIAAVPTNVAAVLHAKTEGKVQILAVNTLGVLYIMTNTGDIGSVADLAGRTILSAGQGTTTEYVLNYLLEQNGVTDATVEYASEHAEVLTKATAGEYDVVLLPEPFVTQMKAADAGFETALDLTAEWKALGNGALTMGCIAVRTAFAAEDPVAVAAFLQDYAESIDFVTANTAEAAAMIEQFDIAKAAIAAKALPNCNITLLTGEAMKTDVSAYLSVLAAANPQSVGGAVPADDFYYIAE